MGDVARGIVFDDKNLTVGEYLDRFLEDVQRGSVRESTYSRDKYLLANRVKSALGRVKLRNLSAMPLQRLYRNKLDAGLSPAMVQKTPPCNGEEGRCLVLPDVAESAYVKRFPVSQ
jgi:hypothetical protein